LGDPLKGNLLLFYKPLHLEAQQVSTRIEVRRHQVAVHKQGKKESKRKLTSQQLASRLDNAKDERFALFTMDNLSHQTGYLFFKGGDFLHIATGLASLFYSLLCLAFG
jgi:hypothetical protein